MKKCRTLAKTWRFLNTRTGCRERETAEAGEREEGKKRERGGTQQRRKRREGGRGREKSIYTNSRSTVSAAPYYIHERYTAHPIPIYCILHTTSSSIYYILYSYVHMFMVLYVYMFICSYVYMYMSRPI